MPVITVTNLTKTYRYHEKAPGLWNSLASLLHRPTLEKTAVADVTFSLDRGEIVGFLGPNGAGKTTNLKMLCGLLYPTGGTATVLGHLPARRERAFLRQIALVMGQKSMLWWDLPAMETLLLHKDMYGLDDAAFHRTVAELATLLDVDHLLRVQVRKLSLGERMKLELLVALVHRPPLLFLDEPTLGLDVVAQQRLRDFLRQVNRDHGTTILVTSHYMADIEALCPRVLLIDHGCLYFDGPLIALVDQVAPHKRLTATFADAAGRETARAAFEHLAPEPAADPCMISLAVPRADIPTVTARLLGLGHVIDLSVGDVPVEQIIRTLFSRPSSESMRPGEDRP